MTGALDSAAALPRAAVQTADGRYVDLEALLRVAPPAVAMDIRTVAHALAHLCRFTGHVREFYSVAQHSYLCSLLVPPAFALEALMHDAHEALIGDVSAPMKALLPDFQTLETAAAWHMRRSFALPAKLSLVVKAADIQMLAAERRDLLPEQHVVWAVLDKWEITADGVPPICPWPPAFAREAFLGRFEELTAGGAG